jgi:excisionase family DNA binding protein
MTQSISRTPVDESGLAKWNEPSYLAERWRVEVGTCYKWVRSGLLPAIRLGRSSRSPIRVSRDAVLEFESNFIKASPESQNT